MTVTIPDLWDYYRKQRQNGPRPLTNMGKAQQEAFTAGVHAYRDLLNGWDALTDRDALEELRLGEGSLYQPLFADDPRLTVDCGGHCNKRITIDERGICDDCGWTLN